MRLFFADLYLTNGLINFVVCCVKMILPPSVSETAAVAADKQEARRTRVRNFVVRNPDLSDSDVVQHSRTRVTAVPLCSLKRIRENSSMKKRERGGKKKAVLTSNLKQRIVTLVEGCNM